jgi:hypothetical protein
MTLRSFADVQHGWIAQLVEQWTENPRVTGSIPVPATLLDRGAGLSVLYFYLGLAFLP